MKAYPICIGGKNYKTVRVCTFDVTKVAPVDVFNPFLHGEDLKELLRAGGIEISAAMERPVMLNVDHSSGDLVYMQETL